MSQPLLITRDELTKILVRGMTSAMHVAADMDKADDKRVDDLLTIIRVTADDIDQLLAKKEKI